MLQNERESGDKWQTLGVLDDRQQCSKLANAASRRRLKLNSVQQVHAKSLEFHVQTLHQFCSPGKSKPKPRPSSTFTVFILRCEPLFQPFSASCCKRHSPGASWFRPCRASSRQKQQQCWMATGSWCLVADVSVQWSQRRAYGGFVQRQQQTRQ